MSTRRREQGTLQFSDESWMQFLQRIEAGDTDCDGEICWTETNGLEAEMWHYAEPGHRLLFEPEEVHAFWQEVIEGPRLDPPSHGFRVRQPNIGTSV